jgi:ABC-2 type transport system permease protein
MSWVRIRTLVGKDLHLGPRSPLVLWALVLPVVMTLLLRGIFGGLFGTEPRLGIVDLGDSELVAAAQALEGVEVVLVGDAADLRERLEANDLDAGLVLPAGFDDAVREGRRPTLELSVGGESLASDRILLAVTAMDLARALEGRAAPVDVEVVAVGDAGVPMDLRLLPLVVMMTVAIAGGMIPAAGLVEEKGKGTLQATLVTPATMGEVLLAKAIFGWALAVTAGLITLAINGALGAAPLATVLAIGIGAAMMAQVGLMLGAWAPDTNTLFAAWKGGGMVLFFPVVFFAWPELPTWPAYLGPTFYFLRPVYAISVEGATLADVGGDLAVAVVLIAALLPATIATGRWLERRLGAGRSALPPSDPARHDDRELSGDRPAGTR